MNNPKARERDSPKYYGREEGQDEGRTAQEEGASRRGHRTPHKIWQHYGSPSKSDLLHRPINFYCKLPFNIGHQISHYIINF